MRLEAHGLVKRFGAPAALGGADLVVPPGEVVAVLGPSGAGKTTLLRIAALLLAPDEGSLRLDGAAARPGDDVARRIGWVGQKPVVFRQSAYENVVFGLRARRAPEAGMAEAARGAMEPLGLWPLRDRAARSLSGGEQQRVAFARAAVLGPSLLVLDEFTANLDPANAALLEREVRRRAAQGTAVLAATHDLQQARRLADRVSLLLAGRVVEEAPAKEFFEAPRTPEARAFVRGELVGAGPSGETY